MTKILLLGETGQVGHELRQTLAPLGTLVIPGRTRLDLTQPDSIRSVILNVKPDVIVNAAGFTIVDAAEAQPDLAMQVNGIAPGIMAESAKKCGALLFHYSTTFVFDGTKRTPYTEEDLPNPINAYGRSKLAAEHAIQASGCDHIVIRANWTYSSRRTNFALKMLELALVKSEIRVVDDQIGAPTWARAYAEATAEMLISQRRISELREKSGIYNLSATGQCTRFEWAELVFEYAEPLAGTIGRFAHLRRTTTRDYSDPAPRPLYTVTDNHKILKQLGIRLREWDGNMKEFILNYFGKHVPRTGSAKKNG